MEDNFTALYEALDAFATCRKIHVSTRQFSSNKSSAIAGGLSLFFGFFYRGSGLMFGWALGSIIAYIVDGGKSLSIGEALKSLSLTERKLLWEQIKDTVPQTDSIGLMLFPHFILRNNRKIEEAVLKEVCYFLFCLERYVVHNAMR